MLNKNKINKKVMRDQQLKEFSEEIKRGFVEALGHKSSFLTPKNKINKK